MLRGEPLKTVGITLGLAMISMLGACSASSPDTADRLNGAWDCRIGDIYTVFTATVNGNAIMLSNREGTIEAQIVKIDGDDIYLASPAEKEQGLIRFTDDNSFTLRDAVSADRPAYTCKRKN